MMKKKMIMILRHRIQYALRLGLYSLISIILHKHVDHRDNNDDSDIATQNTACETITFVGAQKYYMHKHVDQRILIMVRMLERIVCA